MKKFKNLFESVGSPAVDSKVKKDDEEEVKGYKPRSKGEEDFVNQHKVVKKDHPVAEPHQHTGDRKGPKSDSGEDHEGFEKKGEPVLKTYDQFKKMGGWGSSSKRGPDKTAGDKTAVMQGSSKIKEEKSVSEDTEIQEISKKEDLDEAFKVGTLKLKDGSTVKVNESTAKVLNNALSQLSASNKKRMEAEAMKNKSSFESMVKFAKATV
jgi:hypothetical protein